MKVGILSLNINTPDFNYGAMLHSWAFQQHLRKLPGVEEAVIIDYLMPSLEGQKLDRPVLNSVLKWYQRQFFRNLAGRRAYLRRYEKFQRFIREHMETTKVTYNRRMLNGALLPYDAVIAESDIIWSPYVDFGKYDPAFFLTLDSMKGMNRIAYSPCVGTEKIKPKQEAKLRGYLRSVDHISCRDGFSKRLIGRYTEKPVAQVLDPVLLLEAREYDGITAGRICEEPYILLYLPVNENPRLRQAAMELAGKNGLKTVEISTMLVPRKKDPPDVFIPDAGMEEFLSAVRYADKVFTNSFHAICFSILFGKEFYAFPRRHSEKIIDICRTFGLEDRYCGEDWEPVFAPVDYEKTGKLLEELREESAAWLNGALGI